MTGIWTLYHKMWVHAVVLYIWAGLTAGLGVDQGLKAMMSAQFFLYHLPISLLYGLKGNQWLASHLRKLGYEQTTDVEALSPEDALAKAAIPSQTSIPFQHVTDSSSPSSTGLAEQLARLNALHQQGALSGEEYQAAKAKLLS